MADTALSVTLRAGVPFIVCSKGAICDPITGQCPIVLKKNGEFAKDYSGIAFLLYMRPGQQLIRLNTAALVALALMLSGAARATDSAGDSSEFGALPISQAGTLAPAALEASGAIIRSVHISNGSVFDLDDPEENKAMFRLANRLHRTTRADVIAQQLLFAPGDPFSAQALEETERLLRANRYLDTVSVQPVQVQNGKVDVNIETRDVWTLEPRLEFEEFVLEFQPRAS